MNRRYRYATRSPHCALLVACVMVPGFSLGADLTGTVKDKEGHPLTGALVTLTARGGMFAESVYVGRDGHYSLHSEQEGKATLRARNPYFSDVTLDINLPSGAPRDFVLARLVDPQAISDSLPASAHFAALHFERPLDRQWFQVDCLSCHQIGNAFTRARRPPERWHEIVGQMLSEYGVKNDTRLDIYANVLENTFNAVPPLVEHHNSQLYGEVLPAKIIEWKLPGSIYPHDTIYRPTDRRFYTVDQGNDAIYITDPLPGTTETYTLPKSAALPGEKPLDPTPSNMFVTGVHSPHSLQEGPNGHLYTTNSVSNQIGEFDPKAHTYVGYNLGADAEYPHTLRIDRRGQVWFTIAFSNKVGMFDTHSHKMRFISLPADSDRPQITPQLQFPYGIDINPTDDSVWYASLLANRIGRIDPQTFKVESFTPPTVGPRRLRFAKDGTLWIPDFGRGRLIKLDTRLMKYKSYTIPSLSKGEVEAPYAVVVDSNTQEVWITSNMSDRMFRFLPREERFIAYPLPARGTYLRDLIITPEGMVCGANNPVPVTVLEGGMGEVLCLDPTGNMRFSRPARE